MHKKTYSKSVGKLTNWDYVIKIKQIMESNDPESDHAAGLNIRYDEDKEWALKENAERVYMGAYHSGNTTLTLKIERDPEYENREKGTLEATIMGHSSAEVDSLYDSLTRILGKDESKEGSSAKRKSVRVDRRSKKKVKTN